MLKTCIGLRATAESDDNSLLFDHYKRHLIHCYYKILIGAALSPTSSCRSCFLPLLIYDLKKSTANILNDVSLVEDSSQ